MNLKDKIEKLDKQIEKLQKERDSLAETCTHDDVDVCKYTGDSGTCKICKKYLDFYCPTSPIKECVFQCCGIGYWECEYCGGSDERK